MRSSAPFLNASEAARRLGVSTKALRLYERRGLMVPVRTAAGWRAYSAADMARAAEIVALRHLGLSLAEVAHVLAGDAASLEPALAAHQAGLENRVRQLAATLETLRVLRSDLAAGKAPDLEAVAALVPDRGSAAVAFDLPWPWGGERFELFDIKPITYIIGPLGSGKTRLALALAQALPGAAFVGLQRLEDGADTQARLDADPALMARVEQALARLVDEGATASRPLRALLAAMELQAASVLVVDMVEQGLDRASQAALSGHLRRRGPDAKPLFLLTRSTAMLDLDAVTSHETIILCPANHSPPRAVAPHTGAPGFEAVALCLASPEIRARTEGVVAWRPN